jgi:hypothetical protein
MAEEEQEERPPDLEACPNCGSPEIYRRKRWIVFVVVAVIAQISGWVFDQAEAAFYFTAAVAIFTLVSDRWKCAVCDESWK